MQIQLLIKEFSQIILFHIGNGLEMSFYIAVILFHLTIGLEIKSDKRSLLNV